MITAVEHHPEALYGFLAAMAQKYFPRERLGETEPAERIAARVMTAGTYRDVCELVDLAGRDYLLWVFNTSPQHWFSAPAREYWQRHFDASVRSATRARRMGALGLQQAAQAQQRSAIGRTAKH
ncbi:hypothetical protein [Salinisphaera sp.]|uniref:hypothetical protein n=1 Tax=Salinisphaera sp. TaxID=1914330 RepID=UPI0025ECE7D1|nr:hypothetical protein [Salinisphaera sp.]